VAAKRRVYQKKNRRLYVNNEPIYKLLGWGLGEGIAYYVKGKGKHVGVLDGVIWTDKRGIICLKINMN